MVRCEPVIAIDGPSGVGKSTTARNLARRLGYVLVDTGALYRGVAYAAFERGIAWDDERAVAELSRSLELSFLSQPDGAPRLQIDGSDCADKIRNPDISSGASQVSAYPGVRAALLDAQRSLGSEGAVVLEGRDIGTVVFPDAEVKIFLTAAVEERARRRAKELQKRGIEVEEWKVLEQIQHRDTADSKRSVAPLRPADDAIELDSTELDLEATVGRILEQVRAWEKRRQA